MNITVSFWFIEVWLVIKDGGNYSTLIKINIIFMNDNTIRFIVYKILSLQVVKKTYNLQNCQLTKTWYFLKASKSLQDSGPCWCLASTAPVTSLYYWTSWLQWCPTRINQYQWTMTGNNDPAMNVCRQKLCTLSLYSFIWSFVCQ